MSKRKGRRKTQLQYFVQDWSELPHFWWSGGNWKLLSDISGPASSIKHCKNQKIALKYARKLRVLGGSPLISRRVLRKKTYWQDFYLRD